MEQQHQHHRRQQAAASFDGDHENEEVTEDEMEEQEEDEDLLDFLVVSAITSTCIDDFEDKDDAEAQQVCNQPTNVSRKRRRRSRRKVMWTNEDGTQHPFTPKHSLWYNIYVAHPEVDNDSFNKKFWIRFCLPYPQLIELVRALETEDSFRCWHEGNMNCKMKESTPLSHLVLSALCYLGRGWTVDDLSENTAISLEVIQTFFHQFIRYGSTVLYCNYVRSSSSNRSVEASWHMDEYASAGFPGAVGSTDATHFMLQKVNFRFCQAHMGFKMSQHTARTYNLTVNHCCRIPCLLQLKDTLHNGTT